MVTFCVLVDYLVVFPFQWCHLILLCFFYLITFWFWILSCFFIIKIIPWFLFPVVCRYWILTRLKLSFLFNFSITHWKHKDLICFHFLTFSIHFIKFYINPVHVYKIFLLTTHDQYQTSASILHTSPRSDISWFSPFLFCYPNPFNRSWTLSLKYHPRSHFLFKPSLLVQLSHLVLLTYSVMGG